MGLLRDTDISRAHAAALAARLSRSALLAGLDRFLVAEIPNEPTLERQLRTDLRVLDGAGKSANGSIPLEMWLTNAEHLSSPARVEADVFRRSAEDCRIAAVRISPNPSRSTWGAAPSRVLSILEQVRSADPRLFGETELVAFVDAVTTSSLAWPNGRESLLAGLPPVFCNEIPRDDTSVGQIALDIAVLSRERFAGLPIARWLANACFLTRLRRERTVFSEGMTELLTRTSNPHLVTDASPPLATTVESTIELAATYLRPQYLENMFAGLSTPRLGSSLGNDTLGGTALLLFYRLYAATPGANGEWPFLLWLRNLRVVAKVTDTDPITTELQELEARYVRSRGA